MSAANIEVLKEPIINGNAPNNGGSPSGFQTVLPKISLKLTPFTKTNLIL